MGKCPVDVLVCGVWLVDDRAGAQVVGTIVGDGFDAPEAFGFEDVDLARAGDVLEIEVHGLVSVGSNRLGVPARPDDVVVL